ncbi:galactose-binding domain-containing protein [Lysobacter terrae]
MLAASPVLGDEIERNWALNRPANQSSTALGGAAARAVDGNTNGDWSAGSVTHTNEETDPYWEVDLGLAHYIDEIRIYNRTDCCAERLSNFVVFFSNSKMVFQHRDLASTLVENTTSDPKTMVFSKPFFQAGDIDPITNTKLARHTVRISGDDCGADGKRGCLMRHIRIQLAGKGILSLAEVQIVEKSTIQGPSIVGDSMTWRDTGIRGSGIALAANDTSVLGFYRGDDGRLYGSVNFTPGLPVRNSPVIGGNVPAAVREPGSGTVYVAASTRTNDLVVVAGVDRSNVPPPPPIAVVPGSETTSSTLSDPTWTTLGRTTAAPAMVLACDRIHVAWLDRDNVFVSSRSTAPGSSWIGPAFIGAGAKGAPSIAANSDQTVGVSFVRRNGKIVFREAKCDMASGPAWSEEANPDMTSSGRRVSLAAYGPYFMAATIGGRRTALFALQGPAPGTGNGRRWQIRELLDVAGPATRSLADDPQLLVMSGIPIALARSTRGDILYWVRWPNRLDGAERWLDARVAGAPGDGSALAATGGGVLVPPPGGMPAATIAFGRSRIEGIWDAPAELFVAGSGPGRQIFGMNLGRFVAVDVLTNSLGINITGQLNIRGEQPDRGVDAAIAPNIFEQMVAVLALPKAGMDSARQSGCGMNLQLDRSAGGNHGGGCPWKVLLGSETYSARTLMHEWLHGDVAGRELVSWEQFGDVFPFDPDKTRAEPGRNGLRACTSGADCGPGQCERAGEPHPGVFDDTHDFDPPEIELRRWDDVQVCVAAGGPDGRRYQGGVRWYDVGTADHAFIETVTAYRWFGAELRDLIADDVAHGNDQLQRRYNWIRDNYYGGVEYNGRDADGGALPGSDRTLGVFGLPSR